MAEQGSVVGRNGLKAEGPNTYEERAPSVANVEISGLLKRKDESKQRVMEGRDIYTSRKRQARARALPDAMRACRLLIY